MKTAKQILTVIVGTVISGYGIDLAIHAGFGGATLAVLWDGIHNVTNLTLGQASFGIAFFMVVFCWFYDRKQISWGTIIFQIVYSTCIDFFADKVFYTDNVIINGLLMLLGLVILNLGVAIYAFADFGRGSYEALTLALVHRNGWKTAYVRTALDALWVILGTILGGKPGLCTIATILLSGLLMHTFLNIVQKINNKIGFLDVEDADY